MKCFTTLLALLTIFLFAGCGSDDGGGGTQVIPVTRTVTETVEVEVEVEVLPDLPDLIGNLPYAVGDTLPGTNTFAVRVVNVGTDPAPVSVVHVKCYVTSSFDTTDEISVLYDGNLQAPTLSEGAAANVAFDVNLSEATQWIRIEVTVDAIGSFPEINEANNTYSVNLLIRVQGVST